APDHPRPTPWPRRDGCRGGAGTEDGARPFPYATRAAAGRQAGRPFRRRLAPHLASPQSLGLGGVVAAVLGAPLVQVAHVAALGGLRPSGLFPFVLHSGASRTGVRGGRQPAPARPRRFPSVAFPGSADKMALWSQNTGGKDREGGRVMRGREGRPDWRALLVTALLAAVLGGFVGAGLADTHLQGERGAP